MKRHALLFMQEGIQLALQFVRPAPIDFPRSEGERLADNARPGLGFEGTDLILVVNSVDLPNENAGESGEGRLPALLHRLGTVAEPDQIAIVLGDVIDEDLLVATEVERRRVGIRKREYFIRADCRGSHRKKAGGCS